MWESMCVVCVVLLSTICDVTHSVGSIPNALLTQDTRRETATDVIISRGVRGSAHDGGGLIGRRRDEDDLASVRAAVLHALVPSSLPGAVTTEVAALVANINVTGAWDDIDYFDEGRSWWLAAEHLRRTLLMATALRVPGAPTNTTTVRAAAERALFFWVHRDPQNQWWWMQIGVPRAVAKILLLLDNATLADAATPLLSRTSFPVVAGWTGCNRVWGASFQILLGVLEGNITRVDAAFAMAHSTLVVGTQSGDGIQRDGSFHQYVRCRRCMSHLTRHFLHLPDSVPVCDSYSCTHTHPLPPCVVLGHGLLGAFPRKTWATALFRMGIWHNLLNKHACARIVRGWHTVGDE